MPDHPAFLDDVVAIDQRRHFDIARCPARRLGRLDQRRGQRQRIDPEQDAQHHPEITPVG